jgi:hypothetical protein
MSTLRSSLLLALVAPIFFGSGCKKSKEQLDAEESQKIIEAKSALRERLRKDKAERAERERYLKAHPELLEPPAEPDPAHRPTAPAPSNLPPQLFGAPAVDPAIAMSAFAPASASPSAAKPLR